MASKKKFSHVPGYTNTGLWLPMLLTSSTLMNSKGTRKRLKYEDYTKCTVTTLEALEAHSLFQIR